mmetsp:Transcript_27469/g.40689  ORF Transcript_27469/g.40689 Transcript_27469/m.40689 type:complete len:119 (-) Transcript_27469:122-478(-)
MFCNSCSDNSKREKFVNQRVVLKQVVVWNNKNFEKDHSTQKDNLESTHLLQKSVDQDNLVRDSCAICWCPYRHGEIACTSSNNMCQHVFHTDCIMPWFVERKRHDCPLCRRNFLRGFP